MTGLAVHALTMSSRVKLGVGERLGRGRDACLDAAVHLQPHHFLQHVMWSFLMKKDLSCGSWHPHVDSWLRQALR